MPQLDTLTSSLDAMEKGILYHSDENIDDLSSNHSSSPPILSARIPWFDPARNQHTDPARNQHIDPSRNLHTDQPRNQHIDPVRNQHIDPVRNQHIDQPRNQHTDLWQCPTQSKMSKPSVNVPEVSSVLSKSSIINRLRISYQLPNSTLHHPGIASQRPEFIGKRPSSGSYQRTDTSQGTEFIDRPRSSFQRTDTSIQQQNVSIGFPGSFDNRPKSDIQYPIQHRDTVIRHGSTQLPEHCTIRPENGFTRSNSIPHPATVTLQGLSKFPGRSISCPDNAICQADIPRSSTNQTDHAYCNLAANTLRSTSHTVKTNRPAANTLGSTSHTVNGNHPAANTLRSTNHTINNYYPAANTLRSTSHTVNANHPAANTLGSTNHTVNTNHPAAIPRRPTQRLDYATNRPDNSIYNPSSSNHRVNVTIPPQNSSIQRPESVIVYSGSLSQHPRSHVRHPGYAIPHPDMSSRRSECFPKNSDNFSQRKECSIIQMV